MEISFVGYIKFRDPVVEFVAKVVDFYLRRMTDREISKGQSAGRLLTELIAKDPAKAYEAMQESLEVIPGRWRSSGSTSSVLWFLRSHRLGCWNGLVAHP